VEATHRQRVLRGGGVSRERPWVMRNCVKIKPRIEQRITRFLVNGHPRVLWQVKVRTGGEGRGESAVISRPGRCQAQDQTLHARLGNGPAHRSRTPSNAPSKAPLYSPPPPPRPHEALPTPRHHRIRKLLVSPPPTHAARHDHAHRIHAAAPDSFPVRCLSRLTSPCRASHHTVPPSLPALAVCQCRIDLCRCNYRPNMPPTPRYIELWKPSQELQPQRGVYYLRHSSFTESGSSI